MERCSSTGSRSLFNSNNNRNDARAMWNSGTSPRVDWYNTFSDSFINQATTMAATPTFPGGEGTVHALMVNAHAHPSPFASCLYNNSSSGGGDRGGGVVGGGSQYPDPHLMCLKLGKRHYFGDAATPLGDRQGAAVGFSINDNSGNCVTTIHGGSKRGKPYYELVGVGVGGGPSTSSPSSGVTVAAMATAAVPRCQVDGCHVVLVNAKDYHRRHKVCEMHSKTPKVMVLGLEQRFCQQCSRFHAVAEFDESKRSCRRRLAGHNERRRKSSQDQSAPKNQSQQVTRKLSTYGGRHPHLPMSNGCALSLLSSKNDSWISSGDLPARCGAALGELIAENRAAILARQLIVDKDWQWHHYHNHHHHHPTEDHPNGRQNGWNSLINYQQQMDVKTDGILSRGWDRISEAGGGQVTLDLMQAPNSAFGFLSVERNSKEDGECMP